MSDIETKHCRSCDTRKLTTEFNRYGKGLQAQCRECQREWYLANKDQHMANTKRNTVKYREQARIFVMGYLREHPCVDCGEPDPIVLDFDHLRDKTHTIAKLIRNGASIRRIKEEISKCEVRCANCHRRVTAKRAGDWWKALMILEDENVKL